MDISSARGGTSWLGSRLKLLQDCELFFKNVIFRVFDVCEIVAVPSVDGSFHAPSLTGIRGVCSRRVTWANRLHFGTGTGCPNEPHFGHHGSCLRPSPG